jgi:hypothetical protein
MVGPAGTREAESASRFGHAVRFDSKSEPLLPISPRLCYADSVAAKTDTPRKAGRKKKGPPKHRPTQDERDACALMAAEAQLKKLTWKEIDEAIGASPGFTGRLMRGQLRYTDERGRLVREGMNYDEDRFQQELAYRKALRRAAKRSWGWGRSPDRKRARHKGAEQPRGPGEVRDDSAEETPPPRPEMLPAVPWIDELINKLEPARLPEPPAAPRKEKPPAEG